MSKPVEIPECPQHQTSMFVFLTDIGQYAECLCAFCPRCGAALHIVVTTVVPTIESGSSLGKHKTSLLTQSVKPTQLKIKEL